MMVVIPFAVFRKLRDVVIEILPHGSAPPAARIYLKVDFALMLLNIDELCNKAVFDGVYY